MKKKTFLAAVILSFLASSSVAALQVDFGKAQIGTRVIGTISSNTTWTKANSPYLLTGLVSVNKGVSLVIEAGTAINLANYTIQVSGTLVAEGTDINVIHFNDGQIFFMSSSENWNEQTGLGCIIEKTELNSTYLVINSSSPKIMDNILNVGISVSGAPIISNNTITAKIVANPGSGIFADENSSVYILNNEISGFEIGILTVGSSTIENNLIFNCVEGIEVGREVGGSHFFPISISGHNLIRNNTITTNHYGLDGKSESSTVNYNNIYDNSEKNIYGGPAGSEGYPYNWWGTISESEISLTIQTNNQGNGNFQPFLTKPNPQALPAPNTPVRYPSPSPNLTLTPTPTQLSSPVPSLSPTPSIPEFSSWIILPSLLIIAALAGVLFKRRIP